MKQNADLLIEVGTEELPPKALPSLSRAFETEIASLLEAKQLRFDAVQRFATPRRLAVKVIGLQTHQADQTVDRRGPAVAAAFDANGEPTKAALGFAKSCGTTVDKLGRNKTDKGEWLSYTAEIAGESTSSLVPAIVEQALAALPIPKRMRWGSSEVEFVRPVHWLVILLGDDIVPATILDTESNRVTRGHRFHDPEPISIAAAADYPDVLTNNARVIADFDMRKDKIASLTTECAKAHGGDAIVDEKLLEEVTALVEWPSPVCGTFDAHFLELPKEVLIASMQDHQKYFPMESHDGELINKFITISNIESSNPGAVKAGNERVIRPRLSDAKFFWDQDLKSPLADKTARLDHIVFEKQLGSLGDKTRRVAALAKAIAVHFGANENAVLRAAELSRADLVSEMVGEFPELQGVMAGYYARLDGESTEVADALADFYRPRFAGDMPPSSAVGATIAVADRLDTLVGIFAIGSAPTGDKDPYALRRAALGVLRTLIEAGFDLDLPAALEHAAVALGEQVPTDGVPGDVYRFMMERLRGLFLEQGYSPQTIESVLSLAPRIPTDIARRVSAVAAFQRLEEAAQLAAANKRIANLLRKAEPGAEDAIKVERFVEPAEHDLLSALTAIEKSATPRFEAGEYSGYLSELAALNHPINGFFDGVMVMCDDPQLRDNRLALLRRIHGHFSRVADIALLSE